MSHNLMDSIEMQNRLDKGEHPLLVSLDKHRRILACPTWRVDPELDDSLEDPETFDPELWALNHPDESELPPHADDFYLSETCACCRSYWCNGEFEGSEDTEQCPLDLAGNCCNKIDSLWHQAWEELAEGGAPGAMCKEMYEAIYKLCQEKGLIP